MLGQLVREIEGGKQELDKAAEVQQLPHVGRCQMKVDSLRSDASSSEACPLS